MAEAGEEKRREIILSLARDRCLAHRTLFKHRHRDETAPFHEEMIRDWHGPEANICTIAFRGSAKSTIAEEAIIIQACLREFGNAIIFGANAALAQQRLHAIRREFEKNRYLRQIFGDMRGQPWADDKLELTNGVVISAMGRGQALRGTKEEVLRPDLLLFDDIEDRQSVRTPEAREQTAQWVLGEAMPMLDTGGRVRMAANDLDPECLANRLKTPGSGFVVRVYPWEHLNEKGEREATWPSRFPLKAIDKRKAQMTALGRLADYNREFMCHSESPEDKPFKAEMFKIEVLPRTWHAVYTMFDPARTIGTKSATTGFAAWSWVANRLVVWDAWARQLLPDEIVKAVFDCDAEFRPALIGVEEDGLNEWLLQPIRQEQVKRAIAIPYRAMKAPKGKYDFIRGLQPFFHAREVVFAKELPELRTQFLTFPSGRIDAPNALAYALKMRPGAPMYEDFGARNVLPDMSVVAGRTAWLTVNATKSLVACVLCQLFDGAVRVYTDWVREGEPMDILPGIVREANMEAGRAVEIVAGPPHFETFTNVGVRPAIAKTMQELRKGTPPEMGRDQIRDLLRREIRQMPALIVSDKARWTANAFAGGYARAMEKGGVLAEYAEEGQYRILMEGFESFAGLFRYGSPERDDEAIVYDTTRDGRRFISARR